MSVNELLVNNEDDERIQARTDGYYFSLNDDVWVLSRNYSVNVKKVLDILNDDMRTGYINTMAYLARECSPGSVKVLNSAFSLFVKNISMGCVDKSGVIRLKGNPLFGNNKLSHLRVFINHWYGLGYYGVSDEAYDIINSWIIPDNKKGEVVKRRDPEQGPLTDNELQGFNEAAMRAYEKNLISLSQLMMAILVSYTGRRPLQISHMKIKDIMKAKSEDDEVTYLINIPRIKQGYGFRELFRTFRIKKEIYDLICKQAKASIEIISVKLKRDLTDNEKKITPLFLSECKIDEYLKNERIEDVFISEKIHEYPMKFTNTLKKIVELENVISERTMNKLNINSRRFRYTLGTRIAREGYGEVIIGQLLDHSTLTYTGIYVQYNADHVLKIDNAVSDEMAKYSGIFQGKIQNKDDEQDLSKKIRGFDGEQAGSCNQCTSCQANVPVPCYTCMHFRPLLDGPHEQVYNQLISEKRRIKEITGDDRVSETLDRTIYAVAEVIRQCKKIKMEKLEERKL
ncbi:site-specific integrase [Pectobacterium brasiliense]|uniref:Site-specific integrase n=1 Tax=Pectobacterium brasiliense TaxID=180957 RepID=A0AAW9H5H4_9GAMM|nr:site-specific integrase [Pectobacterium brasiliense]MDY4378740.1 site-specific integrase [Pectobacterium brasiliense]